MTQRLYIATAVSIGKSILTSTSHSCRVSGTSSVPTSATMHLLQGRIDNPKSFFSYQTKKFFDVKITA